MLEQVTYETTSPTSLDLTNWVEKHFHNFVAIDLHRKEIAHIWKMKNDAEMGRKRSTFRKQFAQMTFRKSTELVRFTHARLYILTPCLLRVRCSNANHFMSNASPHRAVTQTRWVYFVAHCNDFHFVVHQVSRVLIARTEFSQFVYSQHCFMLLLILWFSKSPEMHKESPLFDYLHSFFVLLLISWH